MRMEPNPAITPARTKLSMTMPLVFTPENRAAFALPPTAYIFLPISV